MNTITSLFQSSIVADNGDAIAFIWIGDEDHAVCIDPNSARVYATLWHDGCRKYHPTLYVSIATAIRILFRRDACGLSLRSFPRYAVDVFRLKCPSMREAQECLHEMLTELRII